MELTVHGKQMDVGESLKTHVQDKIEDLNAKYFNHTTFASVTFSREGHGHPRTRAHISIKLGRDILINAESTENEPYIAFDAAAEKAGKQLRRYKRRLRDHHERNRQSAEGEIIKARDYVLATRELEGESAPSKGNGHDDHAPIVIADMATHIETLTVSDAVMRLELADLPAMLFKNASHGGINMVYRRADGNVGWVDAGD
ncbi:MAG: ribosome hibernation-promoting factor, HPF/YfiA family [Alphaproteobacteria bacterium]